MPVTDRTEGASSVSAPSASPWDAVMAEGRSFGDTVPLDAGSETEAAQPTETDGSAALTPAAPHEAAREAAGVGAPAVPAVPVESQEPAPIAAATPAEPIDSAADPLAGAEPFTYPVDGKDETIEGAYYLKGDGLYVPDAHVPQFKEAFRQARELERTTRDLQQRNQTWERVMQWREGVGTPNERTLTGNEAVIAWRQANASQATRLAYITSIISDPAKHAGLMDAFYLDERGQPAMEGQGSWWIVPNKARVDEFLNTADLRAREAALSVREYAPRLFAAPPPPEPTIAAVVAEKAQNTIAQIAEQNKLVSLNAADKQFLASQLQRYTRQSTQQEFQATGSKWIVDPEIIALAKYTDAQRAEAIAATKNSAKADSFNTGMNKGRQVAPAARATPVAAPTPTGRNAPKARTEPSANDMWANLVDEARMAAQ